MPAEPPHRCRSTTNRPCMHRCRRRARCSLRRRGPRNRKRLCGWGWRSRSGSTRNLPLLGRERGIALRARTARKYSSVPSSGRLQRAHEPPIRSSRCPVHRARARLAAARAVPSLRPGPADSGRHLPAYLARRGASKPARKSRPPCKPCWSAVCSRCGPPTEDRVPSSTAAGLAALRQLVLDRRAMDPERFAHLRAELRLDGEG